MLYKRIAQLEIVTPARGLMRSYVSTDMEMERVEHVSEVIMTSTPAPRRQLNLMNPDTTVSTISSTGPPLCAHSTYRNRLFKNPFDRDVS